jgi:hypothetical protein
VCCCGGMDCFILVSVGMTHGLKTILPCRLLQCCSRSTLEGVFVCLSSSSDDASAICLPLTGAEDISC